LLDVPGYNPGLYTAGIQMIHVPCFQANKLTNQSRVQYAN